MKPTQQNRTGKATKQDVVMTPFPTAKYIVDYFKPTGKMLEPCKGHGAFLRAMQEYNFATKGMSVEDDAGEYITIGEMVLALLAAGDDDIFQAPQGVDPKALQKLNQKHAEKVQGGMQRWDSEVFEEYYNVDNDRVVRLYAKLMNHSIEEVPYED